MIWKGIAIAGIWIGIGLVGGDVAGFMAIGATIASICIAKS